MGSWVCGIVYRQCCLFACLSTAAAVHDSQPSHELSLWMLSHTTLTPVFVYPTIHPNKAAPPPIHHRHHPPPMAMAQWEAYRRTRARLGGTTGACPARCSTRESMCCVCLYEGGGYMHAW